MKNIKSFLTESAGIKLTDEDLENLTNECKKWINFTTKGRITFDFPGLNEDLVKDIAGYVLEAYIYNVLTNTIWIALKNHNDFTFSKDEDDEDVVKFSPLSRRGLKDNDGHSIYWDFTIDGVNEKFEIKSLCKNGKHRGGFSPSKNQRNDSELIYALCKYEASEKGLQIDLDSFEIKRGYKK